MQSRITRIIAAIMALIMVACCFSACKGKNAEEETTTPEIEWPTNPNDDVFVNDGSNVDPNAPGAAQGGNNTANRLPSGTGSGGSISGGSTGGGTMGGGTYYPPSGGSTGGSTSTTPPTSDPLGYLQREIEHFFTHFDTAEERKQVLGLAGYEYDAAQNIYYTSLNPWQRYFGFTDLYDQAAPLTNMWYLTLKIDFQYKDLLWRLQWWKGQYGVLEGAELGVYTKDAYNATVPFYKCAADEHLLRMHFDYYHSLSDYKNSVRLFVREEQEHWWLTGFKFGVVNPRNNVVRATLYAVDDTMADGIEAGLQNVQGANGTWNGFKPYQEGMTETDFYIRNGNRFSVVWYRAGYLNYNSPENPSESNPDINIPEEVA